MISSWTDTLSGAVKTALVVVMDPSKRVYWPFLLGTFVISAVYLAWQYSQKRTLFSPRELSLFSYKLWFHPSSLVDGQLLVIKAIIAAFLFVPWLFSAKAVASYTWEFLVATWGPTNPSNWSQWQISLLYTVFLFLCWDLSRFTVHYLMHRVSFLWELHKVHHSAEVLTPFTNYRSHPLESLFFAVRGLLVTGVVTGIFFYFFHGKTLQYTFLGVNAIGMVFNAAGANLRHASLWIHYGEKIEHVLISPAQHQLHHSVASKHFDKNYGSFLAVWDWLAGSLLVAGDTSPLEYGLNESQRNHNPRNVLSCLFLSLLASVRRLGLFPRRE